MNIRQAKNEDSESISLLAIKLTEKYLISEFPRSAGIKLISSMSPESIAININNGFDYHIAEIGGEIVGLIGIKSNTHLYHLFVSESHQRKGIAKLLWGAAMSKCHKEGNREKVTVNSSLSAKDVYEKLGFVPVSGAQERNGITTIAMEYKFND